MAANVFDEFQRYSEVQLGEQSRRKQEKLVKLDKSKLLLKEVLDQKEKAIIQREEDIKKRQIKIDQQEKEIEK